MHKGLPVCCAIKPIKENYWKGQTRVSHDTKNGAKNALNNPGTWRALDFKKTVYTTALKNEPGLIKLRAFAHKVIRTHCILKH